MASDLQSYEEIFVAPASSSSRRVLEVLIINGHFEQHFIAIDQFRLKADQKGLNEVSLSSQSPTAGNQIATDSFF